MTFDPDNVGSGLDVFRLILISELLPGNLSGFRGVAQDSEFASMDRLSFLRVHKHNHSNSRRGNCHNKITAESFFKLLKWERIRCWNCEAWQEESDCTVVFRNQWSKHTRNGML